MSRTKLPEKDELELTAALDQAVRTGLAHNLSDSELVSRLIERLELETESCRSCVHIALDKRNRD